MKKSFLLLLVTLNFSLLTITAQTNVSGFINANTTWNFAGSPYIVTGNILLSQGYTLTINPGVVVKFDSAKAIQIDGELIAIGNAANRITFTSNKPIPHPGDWGRIQFTDSCVAAVLDTAGNYISGSILKYCNVMYGGATMFMGEIEMQSSPPYFNHCNINYSSMAGIYSYNTTFVFDTSSVRHCSHNGLTIFGGSNLTIQRDTFEFNTPDGIAVSGAKVMNNYFVSNNAAIGAGDGSIIMNNYFENNLRCIGVSYFVDIECNRFVNNTLGCIYMDDEIGGTTISHNIFIGNTSTGDFTIFKIDGMVTNLYFEDNYLGYNSSATGACCVFNTDIMNSYLHINGNEFKNNWGTSIIKLFYPGVSISTINFLDMKNNDFLDPGQIEFYNDILYGSSNVTIDSNYWGSTSTAHLDSAVYDYFDDATKSVVFYSPILTSFVAVDTTCPPSILNTIPIINQQTTSTIYPNPFSETATITFNKPLHNPTLKIYNLYGQIVKQIKQPEAKEIIINRDNLINGFYFYEVDENSRRISSGKIIIE